MIAGIRICNQLIHSYTISGLLTLFPKIFSPYIHFLRLLNHDCYSQLRIRYRQFSLALLTKFIQRQKPLKNSGS